MDLEELRKRLYKEGATFEERPQAPDEYRPGRTSEKISAEQWQEEGAVAPGQSKFFALLASKKFRLYALLAAGILLLIAAAVFFYGYFSFAKKNLELNVYGPEKIVSGETVNYVVHYINKNKVDLEDVKLTFYFPQGSIVDGEQEQKNLFVEKNLGVIKPGQEGQQEFKIQLTGVKDDVKEFKARFSFRPQNISSLYEAEASAETTIVSVPLILSFNIPENIVNGQKVNLSLSYLNDSNISFDNLKLIVKYPNGFTFQEALPEPSEEKIIWKFGQISAKENREIKISGVLNGDGGEIKSFEAILGVEKNGQFTELVRALKSSQIAQAPLSVSQQVNSSSSYTANWGEQLKYDLTFKNTSKEIIRGVTISVQLDPSALDLKSLNIDKGSFNSNSNTITWTNEGVDALGSLNKDQEGTVTFRVFVKSKPTINNSKDSNFMIKTDAKITSPNIPLSLLGTQLGSENILEVKLNSFYELKTRGYFYDQTFGNSGPLPPKVGQTTTYTIYWSLINASNNLSGAKVEAFLPGNVSWQGITSPSNEKISFDSSTRKITWQVGNLNVGTGFLIPARQAIFQVALTPSIVQVGRPAELLQKSSFSAKDTFTGTSLSGQNDALTTELPNDTKIDRNAYNVSE